MDISKFVTVGEDGKPVIDNNAFQSEFDNAIRNAVEKNKNGKLRDEIRKELEEEAKMSADQKLQKEREEFEAFKLKSLVELNQAKAKAKLEGKNFSDAELNFILNTITDKEDSLATLDVLIAERATLIENNRKKAIEELQSQQEKSNPSPQGNDIPSSKPTNATRSRDDIAKIYEKTNL